jgi:hypothetical protein
VEAGVEEHSTAQHSGDGEWGEGKALVKAVVACGVPTISCDEEALENSVRGI